MSMQIRPASESDVPTILRFIRELAAYEREPDAVIATESMIRDALFATQPAAFAVIASIDDEPVGYALYFFNFSTWLGRPGLYLEELYVTPGSRGKGIGRSLLAHLARIASERGCGRMEWMVLDWNETAIEFYRGLGAVPLSEWTVFRLTGETLERAAGSAESADRPSR
jgi:GNAT superfamily N-acetyltransferase